MDTRARDVSRSVGIGRHPDLTKSYGEVTAVDGLDLEVRFGEVFGLLGPNGAGKTTTILMLLGLTERDEGTAEVWASTCPAPARGQAPRRLPAGRRRLLLGHDRPREPSIPRDSIGCRRRRRSSASRRCWSGVGLVEAADRTVETYSRGMRQRLGLADVLLPSLASRSSTSRRRHRPGRCQRAARAHPQPGRRGGVAVLLEPPPPRSSASAAGSASSCAAAWSSRARSPAGRADADRRSDRGRL
jgi:hypothetical protein